MPPESSERARADAVKELFDGMLHFSRSLRSRSGAWNRGLGDLSRGDILTLSMVERQGSARSGKIAAALGVDPSAVSRQLAALERLGLVARSEDPEDRRAEQVSITALGQERLEHNRAAMCQVLADRTTAWDLDAISGAATVVEDLAALLTEPPGTPNTAQPTRNCNEVQGEHV